MTAPQIPGYVAGTWTIDPVHSEVAFIARHMMVSKVRGRFGDVRGTVVTKDNPLDSTVEATIDVASLTTGNEQRDGHVRSADFMEVEKYPTMTYRSTGVRQDGEDFVLDGELTVKAVTKSVPLTLQVGGFGPDAYGGTRAGFEAIGRVNRKDFGVDFGGTIEATGGAIVGDRIELALDVELVLEQASAEASEQAPATAGS